MNRVLFFPSDHGGGKGHVSRALYLSKQLQAQGNEVGIVLENKHIYDGEMAGIPSYLFNARWERLYKYQFKKPVKPHNTLKTKVRQHPVFIRFSGLAYQVPRDGYWSERLTRLRLKNLSKIIENFKPDVLVGDTHFLTYLLGKKYSLPVIQVTRLQGYPPKPDFLWWDQADAPVLPPDALKPFEQVLDKMAIGSVTKVEDLLAGDRYLIPANKELEPVRRGNNSLFYCGSLVEPVNSSGRIPFFQMESDSPKIYVTIGGGAERGQMETFFQQILSVFDQSDCRVLVSTAGKIPAKKYKGLSANVLFVDWVDGVTAIRQSDLVMHHGGYATTMETLLAKKPALVIPSHSEQEGNGRRLEQLEVGKTILPYTEKLKDLKFKWTYGKYTMGAAFELQLDKDEIHTTLSELLYGKSYERLMDISDSLINLQTRFNLDKLLTF